MAVVPGLKTGKADALGIKKELTYKKETYERLTTEHDFVKKSSGLASIGLKGRSREVILISEADERLVIHKWDKLYAQKKDKLRKAKEVLSTDNYIYEVLRYVSKFTNNSLTTEYPGGMTQKEYLDAMIKIYLDRNETIDIGKSGTPDIRAAAPLSKFIKNRCGICRHYNLINSIVVADSIREGILPHGQVRTFRSGGHAVMAYITSGKIWVLDANNIMPFYLVPLNYLPAAPIKDSNEARALTFKKAYGEGFYSEMLQRLLPKKPSAGATAAAADTAVNPAPVIASAAAGVAAANQKPDDFEGKIDVDDEFNVDNVVEKFNRLPPENLKDIAHLLEDFEQGNVQPGRWRPDSPCGGDAGSVMLGPYSDRCGGVNFERKYSAEESAIFEAGAAAACNLQPNDCEDGIGLVDDDIFGDNLVEKINRLPPEILKDSVCLLKDFEQEDAQRGMRRPDSPSGSGENSGRSVMCGPYSPRAGRDMCKRKYRGEEHAQLAAQAAAWPDDEVFVLRDSNDAGGGAAYENDGECVHLVDGPSAHNGDGAMRGATLPRLGPWENLMLDSEQPTLWDTRVWDYDKGRSSPVLFDYGRRPCTPPSAMDSIDSFLANNVVDDFLQSLLDSPCDNGSKTSLKK